MDRVGWCCLAAAVALLCAVAARAETEAEYGQRRPGNGAPSAPKAGSAPRTATYAASAVAGARRLTPTERDERRFLKDAAALNRFLLDAARLALVKGTDTGLRALALTLIDERTVSGDELLRLLHQRGMAAPMLENHDRKTLNRLGRLQARTFDREFLAAVLGSQQEEIAVFEKASQVAEDLSLRNWIARKLPMLRARVAAVERLASPQAASRPASSPARPGRVPAKAGRAAAARGPASSGWNSR